MKKIITLITTGLLAASMLAGCGGQKSSPTPGIPVDPDAMMDVSQDLQVRHVQEGVYVFTHSFPWPANSLAIVSGNEMILVDTPYTPEATEEMLTWLETQVGPKETRAINAHFHIDNLGGNTALIARGIPIYGSDMTVELLASRGQASLDQTIRWLQQEADPRYAETFSDLNLVPPTEVYVINEGLELNFDGQIVEVYYPGPAHAPDNVVVYFPAQKLLFGGCMIIGWDTIGNTADADLQAWPDSVRRLERFAFDKIVPGHGERLDPGLITHTLDLLAEAE